MKYVIISLFFILPFVSADYIHSTANFVIPTYCGDGVCVNQENCATCPEDCGACPISSSPSSGGSRSSHSLYCSDGEIISACICGIKSYDIGFCFDNVYFPLAQNQTTGSVLPLVPDLANRSLEINYSINGSFIYVQVFIGGEASDIDDLAIFSGDAVLDINFTRLALGNYVAAISMVPNTFQIKVTKSNYSLFKNIDYSPGEPELKEEFIVQKIESQPWYSNWILPIMFILVLVIIEVIWLVTLLYKGRKS